MALAACSPGEETVETPGLEAPGTVLTTVQPTRQDVTNSVSLSGKVEINPVFGIAAPVDGELRYADRDPMTVPATRPLWVASVWAKGAPNRVEIPKGSMFAGRLMEDRSSVTEGMPVASARHAGYGIVAEIDSAMAYRISGDEATVKAQIQNGPGPFDCEPLGTIAALPAGTIPEPEVVEPTTDPAGDAGAVPPGPEAGAPAGGSEPTGMRLVCIPGDDIKLINGATVTLTMVTGKAEDVLVLPVEAIAGTQGKGKVDIVGADRTRQTVDVELGLTDGKVVEIKKGLTGDEAIAIPGPNLPAPQPGQGEEAQPSAVVGG